MPSDDYVPITKSAEILLKMPLIPKHRIKYVKSALHKITQKELCAIKQMLNMRFDQPFIRCKGKNLIKVRRLEKAGDFSHSDKAHICEVCACHRPAGAGTKGDFYGLGPSTGHYGVGWCAKCQETHRIRPSIALRQARKQFEAISRYGIIAVDEEYELKLAKEEAETAIATTKIRSEMSLVVDELKRFEKLLECKDGAKPTEWVKGELREMSDKTIISLKLEIAKTISRLNLDHLKIDEDNYVHKDEVLTRVPEMMNAWNNTLAKLDELKEAMHIRGEETGIKDTPLEYCKKIASQSMKAIWGNLRSGRK